MELIRYVLGFLTTLLIAGPVMGETPATLLSDNLLSADSMTEVMPASLNSKKDLPVKDSLAAVQFFNQAMIPTVKTLIKEEGKTDPSSPLAADLKYALRHQSLYESLKTEEPFIAGKVEEGMLILVPYSIEGRGGGNNWDSHYAVILKQSNGCRLISIFNRGGDLSRYLTTFTAIQGNTIEGEKVPGSHFPNLGTVPVRYLFHDNQLIKIDKK